MKSVVRKCAGSTGNHEVVEYTALFAVYLIIASSGFIKERGLFPGFDNWQDGYAAFTYSFGAKDNLIEYVKNQEAHHKNKTFREELIELLQEHGIEFDEKYLE